MKRWIIVVAVLLCLLPVATQAQSVTMTTAQKVPLTVGASDSAGNPVSLPAGATVLFASDCSTCTFTGTVYDPGTKIWSTWFNAGTQIGAFTISLAVTVSGTTRNATLPVTINEVIIIPASVKIVAGTPIPK